MVPKLPEPDPKIVRYAIANLNKVAKWRSILVGRILGTRPADDPPTVGMRDLMDKMVILRVEMTALTRLVLEKRLITPNEWFEVMGEEAEALDKMYQAAWPGIQTTDDGLTMDPSIAMDTLRRQSPL